MRPLPLLVVAAVGCGSHASPPSPCATDPVTCSCTGQCVPGEGTYLRLLFWSGPEGSTPPSCPSFASIDSYGPGYLDAPPSTVTCSGMCSCSNTAGGCYQSTMMSAHTTACPGSGAGVAFNAPDTWDGTCTAMDPVSSATSLTVAPPPLTSGDTCYASDLSVVAFTGGKTIVRTCHGLGTGVGDYPGNCTSPELCTYPDVPGFSLCTTTGSSTQLCPDGWPTRHVVFFAGAGCTCACGPPMGEVCSTTVTAYSDGACAQPAGTVTAASDQPAAACTNLPASTSLGSKSATVSYKAGTCTPTQSPPVGTTLCCLP